MKMVDIIRDSFVVLGIIALIALPYTIFYTYKLWRFRYHTALIKRRLNISFLQLWSIFVFLSMDIWWNFVVGGLVASDATMELVNWIFWSLSLQATIWLSVLKFWLLYYDMRWSIAAHRKQWHRIINPKSIVVDSLRSISTSKSPSSHAPPNSIATSIAPSIASSNVTSAQNTQRTPRQHTPKTGKTETTGSGTGKTAQVSKGREKILRPEISKIESNSLQGRNEKTSNSKEINNININSKLGDIPSDQSPASTKSETAEADSGSVGHGGDANNCHTSIVVGKTVGRGGGNGGDSFAGKRKMSPNTVKTEFPGELVHLYSLNNIADMPNMSNLDPRGINNYGKYTSSISLPSIQSVVPKFADGHRNSLTDNGYGNGENGGQRRKSFETRSHRSLLFYLKYKHTLGSYRYMLPGCLFIALLFAGLQILPTYFLSYDSRRWNQDSLYLTQGLISTASCFIAGIILCILFCQIKHSLIFDDNFYIQLELKYLFLLLTSFFLCNLINIFTNLFSGDNTAPYESDDLHINIIYFFYTILKMSLSYGIWLLHSKWVINKLETVLNDSSLMAKKAVYQRVVSRRLSVSNIKWKNSVAGVAGGDGKQGTIREIEECDKIIEPIVLHHLKTEEQSNNKNMKNDKISGNNRNIKEEIIGLNEIISHKKGIDIFMHHLAREFSVECLLSIVEFIQFQNYIFQETRRIQNERKKKMDNNNNDNNNKLEILNDIVQEMESKLLQIKFQIRLPHTIPNSDAFDQVLICNDESSNNNNNNNNNNSNKNNDDISYESILILNGKKIAYKIYKKYVKVGADYEINIQSRTRKRLMTQIDNYFAWINDKNVDIVSLFYLFEQCFKEMIALLNGCLTRFRVSPAYKKFKLTYF